MASAGTEAERVASLHDLYASAASTTGAALNFTATSPLRPPAPSAPSAPYAPPPGAAAAAAAAAFGAPTDAGLSPADYEQQKAAWCAAVGLDPATPLAAWVLAPSDLDTPMGDETPAAHALRTAGAAAEAAAAARAYEKADNLLTTAELVERQKATLALQGAARGRIARKKVAQARAMEAEGRKRSALLHAKGSGVDIKKRGAAAAAVNDQQKAILGNAAKLLEGEEVAWFGSAKEKEKGGAKKGGTKGGKGGDTPLGAAMKSAKITSDKVRGTKKSAGHAAAAAAKTKKATAMAPAVSEASRREATNRALLATAFAAECRDGDTAKGVPLHRLSKVLSRAHVPGAELHDIARRRRARRLGQNEFRRSRSDRREVARAARRALAAGAAAHPRSSTPAPTAPRCGARRRSRSLKRSRRMTTARAGWRRRRCPFAAAGLRASTAVELLVGGGELSAQRRVDFRDFLKVASTLLVMPVPSAPPASSLTAAAKYMLLNVKELQLLQPPAAPQLFLAARPLRDAGLPPLAPQRCPSFMVSSPRSAVAWALLLPIAAASSSPASLRPPRRASGVQRRGARRRRRRRWLGGARRTSRRGGAERATSEAAARPAAAAAPLSVGLRDEGGHERGRIILAIRSHTGLQPLRSRCRARRRRPSREGRRPAAAAPSLPTTVRR